jgi:hypothetical protein
MIDPAEGQPGPAAAPGSEGWASVTGSPVSIDADDQLLISADQVFSISLTTESGIGM